MTITTAISYQSHKILAGAQTDEKCHSLGKKLPMCEGLKDNI